ncbi:carbohydrate-binding protein, partial [uncultured Chryseobacterium sp.]
SATDYDLGRMGAAYLDKDFVNLWVSDPAKRSEWNSGNQLRNDGVDIYKGKNNEYYVGKTENGEWLQYTINVKDGKPYTFNINYASNGPAKIRVEDTSGKHLGIIALQPTGGNEIWKTASLKGINLKKGENKIRIYFENEGVNLKGFEIK